VLTVLWPKVSNQVHLEGKSSLRLQEKLPEMLSCARPTDLAAEICSQRRQVQTSFAQSEIIECKQVQIHASSVMQVKGRQRRAAGQKELLASICGKESLEYGELQRGQPLIV